MLVVLTPFYLWHLPLPGKRWLVGVAVPLAAVLALGSPLVQGKVRSLLAVQSLDFAGIDAALSGRLYIWDVGLRMLADRPLTGVGAGSFERAYQDYSHRPNDPFRRDGGHAQVYHAHQLYVAVAAETGLPGLLGLIAIWVLLVRWYRRAPPQRRDAARPYAMALFLAAFPLNSQTLLYRPWWFPVLLLLTALLLVCLEGESESAGAAGPSTPAARPAGSP
jgi:O-antigen ligase